jgi:salicylate biosynthesis isochorismate synthase/menaquinone-specific isochorismate synthase
LTQRAGPLADGASRTAGGAGRLAEALTAAAEDSLDPILAGALRRARRSGHPVLASLSVSVSGDVDPAAVAFASRGRSEPWFCLEQPDHARAALGAVGAAAELTAVGPGRFTEIAERWRAMAREAVTVGPAGPLALGGFAFAPDGGSAPVWSGFAPAALVVAEVALARREGEVTATLSALLEPDAAADQVSERMRSRIAALREAPLPLFDPDPVGRTQVASAMPPEHFEAAVARAIDTIGAGDLEKIVLAREVQVHAPHVHDPAAIFGALREEFPACFSVCVGRGDAAFVAASPELLLRREGQRVSTMALAGSTRRSADPAVDAHLGEQLMRSAKDREEHAIVSDRIQAALAPYAVWTAATPEPVLVRVANIQHLATPIRAQLASPHDAISLVGALHPTPAVGGQPRAAALELIPALEGLDRGWYAGPVGWVDTNGDGEFCVALRCALLRGSVAHLYAGVGVVRDSDPAAELAETEVKLGALLPLLAA